jgi:hypothetical protein
MTEWSYTSIILHVGTRWKLQVSFTPRPDYPERNLPCTHWDWVYPIADLDTEVREKSIRVENRTRAIQPGALCSAEWFIKFVIQQPSKYFTSYLLDTPIPIISQQTVNRRLRRFLPNDLPDRFYCPLLNCNLQFLRSSL